MRKKLFYILLISIVVVSSCKESNPPTKDNLYDVIVVGAGGGGLSAAAMLAKKGKRVLVIEQHSKIGGYMTNFRRGDYVFEVSLHAFDGLDPEGGRNIWIFKALGIYDKLKLIKLDPMYRVSYPGLTVDVPADREEYKKLLISKFPQEEQGIEELFTILDEMVRASDIGLLLYFENYMKGLWEFVKQPHVFYTLLKYKDVPMLDFLHSFVKDKTLVAVFTALTGFAGDNPHSLPGLVFAGIWGTYHKGGYYYLEGGSQSISDALGDVIKQHGGEIVLSTRVTKIIIEKNRVQGVRTEHGKLYNSKYVISNANAMDTFFKLVGEKHLPQKYAEDLKKMKAGLATFAVYLGLNKDFSKYFPKDVHGLMVYEAVDPNETYEPIKEGNINKVPFSLVNYSMVDPGASPEGKNAVVCITSMPYDWNNGWKESEGHEAYTGLKNKTAQILLKRAEKYLPGLRKHIEIMEVATPRTNEHFTSNTRGSIIGWANTAEQTMEGRLQQDTPIENLILSGAWTIPGGGQSGVLMSGITAAEIIMESD